MTNGRQDLAGFDLSGQVVLIIDDDPNSLDIITDYLEEKCRCAVLIAEDGESGLKRADYARPDLILLDIMMPGMDGFETCRRLKEMEGTRDIPVIFMTALAETVHKIRGFAAGAVDYVTKPFQMEEVLARVKTHLDLRGMQMQLEAIVEERSTSLLKNEIKLSAVIEAFDGFIYTCDSDCRITYMNSHLINHYGRDLTGEKCPGDLFAFDEKCPWCPDEQIFEKQIVRQEYEDQQSNRWYQVIQSPYIDATGRVLQRQVILYDITERKRAMLDLEEGRELLLKENIRLRTSLAERYRFGDIIGKSKPMQDVYDTILTAAATDASVVILGESGTGKELVAKAIHENSDRQGGQFIAVNCGAIPENLIESEFFGYKKGAFTSAVIDKYGFFDLADKGTLFLDEIGEIPLNMQVKLLRAIEGGSYTPVGGGKAKRPDVRIIAATNCDLSELVKNGKMRKDFFFRIHVIPITLPPLRDRREDIPLLAEHFLAGVGGESSPGLSGRSIAVLLDYEWPGNVRELQNTMQRYVSLGTLDFMGDHIEAVKGDASLNDILGADSGDMTYREYLERAEEAVIHRALSRYGWHQGQVAGALGIDPKTLRKKIRQFGLVRPS